MNEFTKEELKYIRDTMVNIVEVYPDTELPYSIRDKIQRMIDNYCDHKGLIDEHMDYCRCRQCGEKWEIEN